MYGSMESLGLPHSVASTCHELQIHVPTKIQCLTIPLALKHIDLLGAAPTGSGKTACYALPIVTAFSRNPRPCFALILLPNRELAMQVAEQMVAFGKPAGGQVALVIGGKDSVQQLRAVEAGASFIVATPGRLKIAFRDERIRRKFRFTKAVVFDEVDRLIQQPMLNEVNEILVHLPPRKDRMTLMFTATAERTLPAILKTFTQDYHPNHPGVQKQIVSECAKDEDSGFFICSTMAMFGENINSQLSHDYIFVPQSRVFLYCIYLLKEHLRFKNGQGIIFARTKQDCEMLRMICEELDISCCSLHSLMTQSKREHNLAEFRTGQRRVLITTDIASRGLDIASVAFVFNLNVPKHADDYIHRVGRTARAGKTGSALTFVTPTFSDHVREIEEQIGVTMSNIEAEAKDANVLKYLQKVSTAERRAVLQLEDSGFMDMDKFSKLKRKKLSQIDSEENHLDAKRRKKPSV